MGNMELAYGIVLCGSHKKRREYPFFCWRRTRSRRTTSITSRDPGIPGSRDPRRNAGQQTREKSTSFRALPLGRRSSVCRVLKTMAIRCTAGIPDVLRGTHRRRRSLRMLVCVRGDKHAKGTRVGTPKVCASPVDSRFAGSETRRAHRDSHASSPNSAWKSLRL